MVKGVAIGAVALVVVKASWSVIKVLVEIVGKLIYYLGLWAPLTYVAYGAILHFVFGLELFSASSVDGLLYIIGFAVSALIAVVATVHNLIVRPFNKFFKRKDVVDYDDKAGTKISRNAPEAPKIYRSRVNDGVTVYEYSNRYDLYEQRDDRLVLVGTEYKDKKHAR